MPITRKATAAQKGKAKEGEGTSRVPGFAEGQDETRGEGTMPSQNSPDLRTAEEVRRGPEIPVDQPDISGQEMRQAIQLLTRLVASQAHRQGGAMDYGDRVISTRTREFLHLDPPVFTGTNPSEDPQDFIDRMHRALKVMRATDTESVELASYRLQDIAVLWYESWELSRGRNAPPAVWREFSEAFLRHYLPVEARRDRIDSFLALRQGDASVREYSLRFDSLARYAPTIVAEMEDRVHRFVIGLGPHLINECMTASLQPGMDIGRIQAYAQSLEDRKRQQQEDQDEGNSKRARTTNRQEEASNVSEFLNPVSYAPSMTPGSRQERSKHMGSGQSSRALGSRQRDDSVRTRVPFPKCTQCGRTHTGQCWRGTNVCFTCGSPDHYKRDCPMRDRDTRTQPIGSVAASSPSVQFPGRGPQASNSRRRDGSGATGSTRNQNRIYALVEQQEQEQLPRTDPGMISL